MRDWTKTLRRASFRGVPFWVDEDGPDLGRRVAVHEISGGENPVTEDMGRRATTVYAAAYVTGDAADAVGLALEAACAAPGASLLILPMDPPRMMHCLSCRRSRRRDAMGYVGYDLEFVEAGQGASTGPLGLPALRSIFSAGAGAVAAALAALS